MTTLPPADATASPPGGRRIARFSRAQRWAHGLTALLMFGCLATAAALYVDPISIAVGHRELVRTVHLWSGYLLPVPVLVALLLSPAMRRDAHEVDGFTPDDTRWLRARDRRSGRIKVGKFNAGQKLNASLMTGAVLVMLLSGSVMIDLLGVWPLRARTGATFVHDWVALGIFLLVAGHLWYALRDPEALRGITSGTVSEEWARRDHGAWLDGLVADEGAAASAGVAQPGGDAVHGEQQGTP